MAGENGPFGFDPDDLDRFAREAGEGLREVFGKMFAGNAAPGVWASFVDASGRRTETRREPATTGQTGSGVWAVFVVDDTGGARVEQVYASELDALRANQYNTDPSRRVRFLPYGIAVSALDGSALESGEDPADS
ncbi:hypothetical protein GYA93_00230 [Gordonia desulfuricans]|uniref:Transmembrane protein n=1 Tax=Gordonia desulfuricans TaxID=89051 RepID=A0A7K3LIH0_9ACTN|nr:MULTISPECIES: hypothetical protein [Gordonia]EMP13963.1 hypothetical protein ISGA_1691 [Gordonia sp. NB41Y]NDK88014.1 hypothetical protein [Gordonia desulfuricans]WLP90001.1 hypothetical protein Q9K23_21105 [Gordonia sp. NB41Y]